MSAIGVLWEVNSIHDDTSILVDRLSQNIYIFLLNLMYMFERPCDGFGRRIFLSLNLLDVTTLKI